MQHSRPIKGAPGGAVNAQMKAQIDENLKRVYQTALSEDVPDRFRDLLAQLQAQDQRQGDAIKDDSK